MELFQVVLPLFDNNGITLQRALFTQTVGELTDKFGGATAFTRNPAEGFWEDSGGDVTHDEVIIVEVLVRDPEDEWWADYKRTLEARFKQDTILIRAIPCRTF
jgi:hypothetical protein